MLVKIIAGFIVADCIALILWFYDTIRLDFYYILAGLIVAALAFAAGWHEAKKRHRRYDFPDDQVEPLVRAFWRRTHHGRIIYQSKELPHPLPHELRAHMLTALTVLKRNVK